MRPRIVLAVVVVLLAALPARADHPPACGQAYGGSADCAFHYRGTPLRVHGESNATNASVHVWVTIEGYPELGAVLECSAAHATKATCDGSLPKDGPIADIPDQFATFYLRCHVTGVGYGTYWCRTGTRS